MQVIELVEGEQVDVSLQLGRAEKVTRDIEHRPAPRKTRTVADASGRDRDRVRASAAQLHGPRHQLSQRLHS